MKHQFNSNHKDILRQLMSQAAIDSYPQLSHLAQVSERQLYRIDNGLINALTLDTLQKIAQALNLSVESFINAFADRSSLALDNQNETYEQLQQEYEQLKQEKEQLGEKLTQEWQQSTISILESLLLQLPTISEAVKDNPVFPASRLLPLLKPLGKLLSTWEVEEIDSVGEIVTYNPQEHELLEDQNIQVQEINQVKVRYVGYRQRGKLLYRAKVSPIQTDQTIINN